MKSVLRALLSLLVIIPVLSQADAAPALDAEAATMALLAQVSADEVQNTNGYVNSGYLAMVLEQLGAAQGSGEGAVNGVIPIRWSKGQLHFDRGFLYSTPGQTGTIRLQGTEMLLAGLPAGSPQHTQLDIATEALKDYIYNWAKLSLESEEDLLHIKLQLDGKPNRLLPFGYDQRDGRVHLR